MHKNYTGKYVTDYNLINVNHIRDINTLHGKSTGIHEQLE